MREKVISLAKGNFTYDTPELLLPTECLVFSVTSGEHKTYSFELANARGSKLKGFGMVEDAHIDFLPFFDGEKNELTMEVDATELVAGERLQGDILFVTDCGEKKLPYDIEIVAPELKDEKGSVRDYLALRERIENNPEHGVELFLSKTFQEAFLYRDESAKQLYQNLTNKNTKLQGMEEFLVAMGQKEPIRFQVEHASGSEISYELNGMDIQDSVLVRVSTWGHTGIEVQSTADFIEPHTHAMWTDEFERGRDVLEFTIIAGKVPPGKRYGELVLQSPYERQVVRIWAHNRQGEQERKVRRAKKAVLAMFFRQYLAFQEKRVTNENYRNFLLTNREVLEKVSGSYREVMAGYISVMLREEEQILEFFRETEDRKMPPIGADIREVENYILIEFIKVLYTNRKEDKDRIVRLLEAYAENGYQNDLLTYVGTQVDERYRSLRLLENDLRAQIENGSNSPLIYSVLMQAYREDATLIATLDGVSVNTINYGLKRDLTTKEVALAVSFLAERLPAFNGKIFRILQKLYDFFVMTDTLHAICGMLIRNEMRDRRYFSWFAKGVSRHLRLTDLFEYYMYTLDPSFDGELPDSVLSYFQYENHLNDTCKAFLFSYIVKHRLEQPEIYRVYEEQINQFAMRQLAHHRITDSLAVLYEECIPNMAIEDEVAGHLPYVMFTYAVRCGCDRMDGVVVVHKECKGETYYPLTDGCAQVQIYTPNAQIYFVDERGRYYAETVPYEVTPMLHMGDYALACYEGGSEAMPLLIHLAVLAERAPRMSEIQAEIMRFVLEKRVFRTYMRERVLLCLYDYYHDTNDVSSLLQILDWVEPANMKKERLPEVAADCIYHGMYQKATVMLRRGGAERCEMRALMMLVKELVQENPNEFEPLLMKWALQLYRDGCYDKGAMEYLLTFYTGDTRTLTAIHNKGKQMPEVTIGESANERLLAQALFVGADLMEYEDTFLEYFEHGENRMLVKAFLSQLAYRYIVEQSELSEPIFVKIEKEAMYGKDDVMVLATLRRYSREEKLADKQRDFVEMNLEKFAGEGVVLAFMKDYIGKVNVPYEIESAVLVQYYSGTTQGVYLLNEGEEHSTKSQQMKQVFAGVFTREMLLFEGEEKACCIYEEESGEKTDTIVIKRASGAKAANGFFGMVNEMIQAKEKNDTERYAALRRSYERARMAADKLFTIHE